jgi:glycosyltransferase involved in cell wall biosynthesis
LFSPVDASSAIGRVSSLVAAAGVSSGHEFRIVGTELDRPRPDHTHGFDVPTVWWEDIGDVAAVVAWADVAVYQIGNFHPFHAGAVHWSQRVPGVVCLHDFFVAGLFAEWALARRMEANEELERWYGSGPAKSFWAAIAQADFVERTHRVTPMTEWICARALAVLTHSSWGLSRVLASCSGPVAVADLPYQLPNASAVAVAANSSPATIVADGRLNLLTVGHINPNKRVRSVIEVIGSDDVLRRSVVYRLVGGIDQRYRDELVAEAAGLGVELVVSGAVPDSELVSALRTADIVVALRTPCTEAASASTIEAMLAGKPTVVSDVGWYSDLPDDCVAKVDPTDEIESLRQQLAALVDSEQERLGLGVRSKGRAERVYRADRYVDALVEVGGHALDATVQLDALRAVRQSLDAWGGAFDAAEHRAVAEWAPFFEVTRHENVAR